MNQKKNIRRSYSTFHLDVDGWFEPPNQGGPSSLYRIAKSLSEGNPDAWEELYMLMFDSIYRFIAHLVRSDDDATDLTQEVFIYLWRNYHNINPEKNIKGYVYSIARTLVFRFLRERIRRNGFVSLADLSESPINDISGEDIVLEKETDVLIAMALETMQPQRKRVFEMSRYEGMTIDQIAKKLNLSRRTVENQIYRATKQLKEIFYIVSLIWAVDSGVNS